MGRGVKFDQANGSLGPPDGMSEEECHTLAVYRDGRTVVSCWELNEAELLEVARTRRVWLGLLSGGTMPPAWISGLSPWGDSGSKVNEAIVALRKLAASGPSMTCAGCDGHPSGSGHASDCNVAAALEALDPEGA